MEFIGGEIEKIDVFAEIAYVYGLTADNTRYPLEAVDIEIIKRGNTETVIIEDEKFDINFEITETEKKKTDCYRKYFNY